MELTEEQKIAVYKLNDFLVSNDHEFLLKGYAGSGKSFLISKFIDQITNIHKHRIIVCAPTHKACKVIREKLLQMPDIKVITVHKLLGMKKDIDENGRITFKSDGKYNVRDYDLIIIDECSMVNIYMYCKINEKFNNTKIIYVGDSEQLPPINQDLSPTFSIEEENSFELLNVMRYNNDILELNTYIRQNINEKKINVKGFLNNLNAPNILYTENPVDFNNLIKNAFMKEKDTKVLCWTNKQVDKYNDKIRRGIFGRDLKKYCNGEKLLLTSYYETNIADEESKRYLARKFYTNDEIVATRVKIVECDKKFLREYIPQLILEDLNIETLKLWKFDIVGSIQEHKILYNLRRDLNKYLISDVTDIIIDYCRNMDIFCYIYKIHDDSKNDFNRILLKLKREAIKAANQYKNNKSLGGDYMKENAKNKWKFYYKIKDMFDAPISYNYSNTIHRSQGSQYDYVFVDIEDINKNRKYTEKNRLLYVATSRTVKKLILFQ